MADLDDFFAKKDRKKSKVKKFTTPEEIAKKMEEIGRKSEKPKDKTNILTGSFIPEGDDLNEEDEEWKNFKEEKKDYTGLKIQNLTIQDIDESDENYADDGDSDDNDQQDLNMKKKGPWKVVDNEDSQPQQAPEVKKVENKLVPPLRQNYVLPQLRNQQAHNRERFPAARVGKPEAPDITNQEFFPTLSAANGEASASWNRRKQDAGFEEVRNSRSHSSRSDPTRTPQTVRIVNKFGALESENS